MPSVQLAITGHEAIIRRLSGDKLIAPAFRGLLRRAVREVRDIVKGRVPSHTGKTRRGVRISIKAQPYPGVGVVYGKGGPITWYVRGTKPHRIPRRGVAMRPHTLSFHGLYRRSVRDPGMQGRPDVFTGALESARRVMVAALDQMAARIEDHWANG